MKRSFTLALLFAFVTACAPPPMKPRRPGDTRAPQPAASPTPATATVEPGTAPRHNAVVLTLHSEGDAEAILKKLESDLELKLTLILPAEYFETQNRGAFVQRFAALQTSKQIEIALTLSNEPNLPLLADLRLAGDKIQKWGFTFAWPDDAAAQTARGSGRYRKRWGQLPSGFALPHGAASEAVMQVLRQFRLSWVLVRPGAVPGLRFFGGTALIVPPLLALDDSLSAPNSARDAVQKALNQPFAHVVSEPTLTPDFDAALPGRTGQGARRDRVAAGHPDRIRLRPAK